MARVNGIDVPRMLGVDDMDHMGEIYMKREVNHCPSLPATQLAFLNPQSLS